jgi:hypothetical protein
MINPGPERLQLRFIECLESDDSTVALRMYYGVTFYFKLQQWHSDGWHDIPVQWQDEKPREPR